MTAWLEIGDEHYTIEDGEITPDVDYPLHNARAEYLNTVAAAWVAQWQRDTLNYYDPDPDCTMATVISRRLNGRSQCDDPAPAPARGQHY
jgi:hypothetical protein